MQQNVLLGVGLGTLILISIIVCFAFMRKSRVIPTFPVHPGRTSYLHDMQLTDCRKISKRGGNQLQVRVYLCRDRVRIRDGRGKDRVRRSGDRKISHHDLGRRVARSKLVGLEKVRGGAQGIRIGARGVVSPEEGIRAPGGQGLRRRTRTMSR